MTAPAPEEQRWHWAEGNKYALSAKQSVRLGDYTEKLAKMVRKLKACHAVLDQKLPLQRKQSLEKAFEMTARRPTQYRSNPVSGCSLGKTGIFA